MCLLTGGILTYAYGVEHYIAWYSDNPYEWGIFEYRLFGEYDWVFMMMVFCNCLAPLVWWKKSWRRNYTILFIVSIIINVGMWFERYNIIASALAHQYDPAAWTLYTPNWVEWGIMAGSFGWFFVWFLLFIRVMPSVAIAEIKELVRPPLKSDEEAA